MYIKNKNSPTLINSILIYSKYLNFTTGWTIGSVANPHQVGEKGSNPCPATMN